MIAIRDGQVKITFENGYTISMINGFGSYTENHTNMELMNKMVKKGNLEPFDAITSETVEVAVINPEGEFSTQNIIEEAGDSVIGYISPDALVEIMLKVRNIGIEETEERVILQERINKALELLEYVNKVKGKVGYNKNEEDYLDTLVKILKGEENE